MRLREAGVPEPTRADILWHTSPSMTHHYSMAQIVELHDVCGPLSPCFTVYGLGRLVRSGQRIGYYVLDKPMGERNNALAEGIGVCYQDLVFEQVAVRCAKPGSIPYIKWIDVGMPKIPQRLLDCVVYLYPDATSAWEGKSFGGSGFLVGVETTNKVGTHLYVVSNWHAAIRDGNSVVRLNKVDGGIGVVELDSSEWTFIPNAGDVAIAPVTLDKTSHRFEWIDASLALTETDWTSGLVGVGEDVFMLGRFVDHDGGQTNAPAMRFGNISIPPSHIQGRANSDASVMYYCLDMHSRTGFSGSPVFVYRTPGAQLVDDATDQNYLPLGPAVLRLLGIHCGQFPENMWLKGDDSTTRTQSQSLGIAE